jgi:RNA polymerase sigma-70 factor (ECF subfamily)
MPSPDDDRFEDLYRRHAGAVYAYARRRTSPTAAEDVAAETFLVCWRRLDRVPDDALPWLYAVARKSLANQRRRELHQQRAGQAATTAIEQPIELPTDPALARAFASLGPRDREILALVAWEGLAVPQAAHVLGCSAVSCRVRLHRAKRRLAHRLEELEPGHHPIRNHAEGVAP